MKELKGIISAYVSKYAQRIIFVLETVLIKIYIANLFLYEVDFREHK